MGKILIKNDLFCIEKRLKQIDKNYYVLYNTLTKKFELHYNRSCNTLELILPYNKLDKRTIDYVLKTRVENKKNLIKEMEENNKKIDAENNKKLAEKIKYKTSEILTNMNL